MMIGQRYSGRTFAVTLRANVKAAVKYLDTKAATLFLVLVAIALAVIAVLERSLHVLVAFGPLFASFTALYLAGKADRKAAKARDDLALVTVNFVSRDLDKLAGLSNSLAEMLETLARGLDAEPVALNKLVDNIVLALDALQRSADAFPLEILTALPVEFATDLAVATRTTSDHVYVARHYVRQAESMLGPDLREAAALLQSDAREFSKVKSRYVTEVPKT